MKPFKQKVTKMLFKRRLSSTFKGRLGFSQVTVWNRRSWSVYWLMSGLELNSATVAMQPEHQIDDAFDCAFAFPPTRNCGLPSSRPSSSRSTSARPRLMSSSSTWRRLYSMKSRSNRRLYSTLSLSFKIGGNSLRERERERESWHSDVIISARAFRLIHVKIPWPIRFEKPTVPWFPNVSQRTRDPKQRYWSNREATYTFFSWPCPSFCV